MSSHLAVLPNTFVFIVVASLRGKEMAMKRKHQSTLADDGMVQSSRLSIANNEYLQLPGAQGLKHTLLRSRVQYVAKVLGGTDHEHIANQILAVLPHLKHDTPHVLKAVDADAEDVRQYIDHTVLKGDTRYEAIVKLCLEAEENKFFAVCVNSSRVSDCRRLLRKGEVKLAAVVGFPLGAMEPRSKAFEAQQAMNAGADEIDMVVNVGWLQDSEYAKVLEDIQGVTNASKGKVKVILEVCLLSEEQTIDGCILCALAGAEFVKTSTGFSTCGATPETVDLMKAVVGNACKVKAAGGVHDFTTAKKYIAAGISRIGTSSGVAIVAGHESSGGY